MKKLSLGIASTFMLVTIAAFAANFTDDTVQIGKPGSSADKSVIFGASNKKKLSHKPGTLTLDYEGNNLSVGDGANTADKTIKLNKGVNSPTIRHNFTSGDLEIENAPVLNQKGNTVSVGDGTNTNKVLKFNKGASSPEIRFNSTTSKLEFSNDASLYKAIGSGFGGGGDGGKNLLTNGSFEDGISLEWSNTGGTFTQGTYTNGTDDDSKYANFVASGSGQYFETTLKAVPDSLGVGCMSDLKYFGGSGNFKLQALDSSANVLSEIVLVNTTSWQKSPTIAFPCPAPGATMRARIISTAAGTIQGDLVYIGGNKNVVNVGNARVLGTLSYPATTNCDWSQGANGFVFTNFAADTDCATPTVSGAVIAPATKIPGFQIAYAQAGVYMVVWNGSPYVTNGQGNWRLSDGTNHSLGSTIYAGATSGGPGTYVGTITLPVGASNWTVQVQSGSSVSQVIENGNNNEINSFTVYYLGSGQDTAISNEQSSWLIDVNVGGGNPAVTTNTTFVEATLGTLDMVINPLSAPAEIPCSATNPSTGLTCAAGNESVGVVFTPPYAGFFEVCGYFGLNSGGQSIATQWVETPNNDQTILQEGKTRVEMGVSGSTSVANCGTFQFNSTAKRTLRLMYEATGAGLYTLDRSTNVGQRDLHIIVKPLLQNVARPVLTGDQVTAPGTVNERIFRAKFNNAGSCSIVNQSGSWVSSCVRNSAGNLTITFAGGTFSSGPTCSAINEVAGTIGDQVVSRIAAVTASQIDIWTNLRGSTGGSASVGADYPVHLICMGPK